MERNPQKWRAVCAAMLLWTTLVSMFSSVVSAATPTTNAGEVMEWKNWVKKNSIEIKSIKPVHAQSSQHQQERFQDLQFMKPLLKDKRIVSLGEASHGASEYNSSKVRLIQFLHEEMGYDVIAFESLLGEASAGYANIGKASALETMENSIYGVWHVKENLELFEYIAERSKTDRPLILTGVDVQRTTEPFIKFGKEWFNKVDPKSKWGDKFEQAEQFFIEMSAFDDMTKYNKAKKELIQQYKELQSFVTKYDRKLRTHMSQHPDMVPIMKRVMQNRIDSLDGFGESIVKLMSSKNPAYFTEMSYYRDQMMADNTAWLAEELYPDKKIIIWGHNYHIRKHNSTMVTEHNGMGYDTNPYPTMGEMLPVELQRQHYAIGLYAYQGSSLKNNSKVESVKLPHPAGSLEDIMKASGYPVSFVNLDNQPWTSATEWMYSPRIAKAWGVLDEVMIVRDQYDGILFFDTIHPSQRLK